MPDASTIVREEHLQRLAPFCRALGEACRRTGLTPEQTLAIWRVALVGECTRCVIPISGEELFALAQTPLEAEPGSKVHRLSLGDCARQGCESYFCRLAFHPHPQADWPALLAQAEAIQAGPIRTAQPGMTTVDFARSLLRSVLTRRVGLALVIIVALLIVRQWYAGGRVPLLREPEHFRVDVDPAVEEQQHDGH